MVLRWPDTGAVEVSPKDFFVSHAGPDRAWAEWVAWQLEQAGYSVELDVWDWEAGRNLITAMSDALDRAGRVVALFSTAYFERERYTTEEWSAVLSHALDGPEGCLVPVRIEDVPAQEIPAVLRSLVFCDVFGKDAEQARRVLLEAVAPRRPDGEPVFPGRAVPGGLSRLVGPAPQFPGGVLRLVNALPRNPAFTGRAAFLEELGRQLESGPVAVRGLGGVGKSQVALEYAYRMYESGRYELVCWIRANDAETVAEDLAGIASLLGIDANRPTGELAAAVVAALGASENWLLVFDNAQTAGDLVGVLPGGSGHVLITSRNRSWSRVARRLDLAVFTRAESVAFVGARSQRDEPDAAAELAQELGDLPLALAQAASFVDTLSRTVGEYLALYRDPEQACRLRDEGLESNEYPDSVARTWLLSLGQLAGHLGAVELLRLCAFLDPGGIDLDLLSAGRAETGEVLAAVLGNQLDRTKAAGALIAMSLAAAPAEHHLRVHRLVQAVTRDQLDKQEAAKWAKRALNLVAAVLPPAPADYRSWPMYAKLAPHIKAAAGHAGEYPILAEKLNVLRDLGIYLSASEQPKTARNVFENVLVISQAAHGPDHPEVAEALGNLGQAQLRLWELEEAHTSIERALAVFQTNYGPRHLEVARALSNLSVVQMRLGELWKARRSIKRVLAIYRKVYDSRHPEIVKTFVNLGMIQMRLGELGKAQGSIKHALDISESADNPDRAQIAKALSALGAVQLRMRKLGEAQVGLERALQISKEIYDPDHPEVASVLIILGAVQMRLGEPERARKSLEQAREIKAAAYGSDHPELISTLLELGTVQLGLGELREARESIKHALRICKTVYDPDHPEVASALINLAAVQLALGKLKKARTGLNRALRICKTVHDPDHPEVAAALLYLGKVQLRLGQLEKARTGLERALGISEAVYGRDHPAVASVLVVLGAVQMRLGEPDEARADLERALEINERACGPYHPDLVPVLLELSAVQLGLGELREARGSIEREAVYRRDHPAVASALINLGAVQLALGEPNEARTGLEDALGISETLYGPDHPEVAKALFYLSIAQLELDEPEKARIGLERALVINEAVYGSDHPEVTRILEVLGMIR
jgi:tetratricopeptide (TPR) repeat protein